jgi:hypothetical protein
MAQQYDVSLKLLFHHSRGLIARRLFGGPVVEWVNVEQPKVTNMRVDLLARLEDGSLRHVEVQVKNDPVMARRQAEYYLGFHRLLGEHVEQIVLYIGQEPLRMDPAFADHAVPILNCSTSASSMGSRCFRATTGVTTCWRY